MQRWLLFKLKHILMLKYKKLIKYIFINFIECDDYCLTCNFQSDFCITCSINNISLVENAPSCKCLYNKCFINN